MALVLVLAAFFSATASAAEPPNQNDPCSTAGRNTCDTLGKGSYENYRYGIRWFGDYRGAVPGYGGPTFCIDLRFWYPSDEYGYEPRKLKKLKNKDGDKVSSKKLARMSYALWNYGRSDSASRQAAVMLYVHDLMGDGAPGEVDPDAPGRDTAALFKKMKAEAERLAGPYRIKLSTKGKLKVGKKAKLQIEVLTSKGKPMPKTKLRLRSSGSADGLPDKTRTSRKGTATVKFKPTTVDGLDIEVTAQGLAAPAPQLYVPTSGAARTNGQRLVAPLGKTYSERLKKKVAPAQVKIETTATPGNLIVGETSLDKIEVSGPPNGWSSDAELSLYGPYRSRDEIDCAGPAYATETVQIEKGSNESSSVEITEPGFYTYRLVVPDTPDVLGVTTPCAEPSETFKAQVAPVVTTQISDASGEPPLVVTDSVFVSGLTPEKAVVTASLHGPFGTAGGMVCDGTPFWTGDFQADGDGTYVTDPVQLNVPGYYTYYETFAGGEFVRPGATECAEATETTIVRGSPEIETQVSEAKTEPGSLLTDTVIVTGLGKLRAPVEVELWGPYDSEAEMDCQGTPYATQTFVANGDGTYETEPIELGEAGYYTYMERIIGTAAYNETETECGEASETTLTTAKPKIKTRVSSDVIKPGNEITDKVKVTGLGETNAEVIVELYGPYKSRKAIDCSGDPFDREKLTVRGDGTYRTSKVKLPKAGFYNYREQIKGSETVKGVKTRCAQKSETSLARPLILTGRGEESVNYVSQRTKSGKRPTRVTIDGVGVRAPIRSVGIDLGEEALGVPSDIDKVGWWVDGGKPGGKGTTLLGGHVDSSRRGAGAFFPLDDVDKGDRIELELSGGGKRTYRVKSIKQKRKEDLPPEVFSSKGKELLVLVTCGGPFIPSEGAYRDNIIVTAVPD